VEGLGDPNVALIVGITLRGVGLPGLISPLCAKPISPVEESAGSDESAAGERVFPKSSDLLVFPGDSLSGGVVSPTLRLPPDSFALIAAGTEPREVDSSVESRSFGDLASIASMDFGASRRRLASGLLPTVRPTVKANTAHNSNAANAAT